MLLQIGFCVILTNYPIPEQRKIAVCLIGGAIRVAYELRNSNYYLQKPENDFKQV